RNPMPREQPFGFKLVKAHATAGRNTGPKLESRQDVDERASSREVGGEARGACGAARRNVGRETCREVARRSLKPGASPPTSRTEAAIARRPTRRPFVRVSRCARRAADAT